jgi:MoxR-like ATPase
MATFADLNQDAAQLQQRVERFHSVRESILSQVREVIVGQDEVLDQVLIALFVGGHCLMTGMPGTAKTLMVRTIAEALGLEFRRIQFTPDLMPSDITGTDIIEEDLATGHEEQRRRSEERERDAPATRRRLPAGPAGIAQGELSTRPGMRSSPLLW